MKKLFLFAGAASLFFVASCRKDHVHPMKQSTIKIENVLKVQPLVESGTFKGTGAPPVILPGQQISFSFSATKGQALTFATMYGWSSDMFFAPKNPGITLYDSKGMPVEGDVSTEIKLWDDGTRVNQAPGMNNPHNAKPDNGVVTEVIGRDPQGYGYLRADQLMNAMLKYDGNSMFTLTIKNISGGTANETPFSPGVWAVSNEVGGQLLNDAPIFTSGEKSANGLQPLSEMGNNKVLSQWLTMHTGIITPLSPVLVVVYKGNINPLFTMGENDRGKGLTNIAQKGDASALVNALQNQSGVRHVYLLSVPKVTVLLPSGDGMSGGSVEGQIDYRPGDKITFATMFGYSNDWFYSFGQNGIPANASGDLSDKITLWDDGTAQSEYPGAGIDQAAFGGNPAGNGENKPIMKVGNNYPVPAAKEVVKITIQH